MNREIFYYYSKFPTNEIKSFKVEDIYYLVKEIDKEYNYVYAIDTYYDLQYEKYINTDDYINHYSLSCEWSDEDIFEYNNGLTKITLSFDKEKLEQSRLQDIKRFETLYGKYVDKCREILKEVEDE